MTKYLSWKEYQTLIGNKDRWGFTFSVARESLGNLKNVFVCGKKKFLSLFNFGGGR